jgi:hypothetical protein
MGSGEVNCKYRTARTAGKGDRPPDRGGERDRVRGRVLVGLLDGGAELSGPGIVRIRDGDGGGDRPPLQRFGPGGQAQAVTAGTGGVPHLRRLRGAIARGESAALTGRVIATHDGTTGPIYPAPQGLPNQILRKIHTCCLRRE